MNSKLKTQNSKLKTSQFGTFKVSSLKFKVSAIALCATGLVAFTGCKTAPTAAQQQLTTAIIEDAVTTGADLGLMKYPQALPFVIAARDVICSASSGSNVSPATIVADLQASPAAGAVRSAEGMVIVNGALALYDTVWASLGTNTARAQPYLQAVCIGLGNAIPGALPAPPTPPVARTVSGKVLPPHLQ